MRCSRALVLFAVAAASAADNEPAPRWSLTGIVVNAATGEPIKKAELALRLTSSDSANTATTNETGDFSLVGADAGTYELVVRKRGFVQTGKSLTLSTGQAITDTVI